MHSLRNVLAAAATAVTLGACAPATEQVEPGAFDQTAMLQVENRNWMDMAIYVVRGSVRNRIGTVLSMDKESFKLPTSLTGGFGDIRIQADPIGSARGFVSPVLNVLPGSQVQLTLQNYLPTSTFAVY